MNLLEHIPHGRTNAVTRAQLCRLTGWSDRTVRMKIKELVRDGHPILSFSESPGYWFSDDLAEIERFLREADSRSRTEYRTTAKLRRMVRDTKGGLIPRAKSGRKESAK